MSAIVTVDDFKTVVEKIKSAKGYRSPIGFGIAHVQFGQKTADLALTMRFPFVNWQENQGAAAVFQAAAGLVDPAAGKAVSIAGHSHVVAVDADFIQKARDYFAPYLAAATDDAHRNVQVVKALESLEGLSALRLVFVYDDQPVENIYEGYLKLMAIADGKAPINGLNLNGIFGALRNVAWSGNTAYELDWLRENEIDFVLRGKMPVIDFVDKFPRLLQQYIPSDTVRILDTARVRAGARLSEGTTVMPGASYINYNAGTKGKVMVEGRISQGVVVGADSDVGGGASTLGTLSGGNEALIAVGERCLLGANAVLGIPFGDGCTIDAGVTVLGGTKVSVTAEELARLAARNPNSDLAKLAPGDHVVKAAIFAGLLGVHLRQHSQTGRIQAMLGRREITLNAALHDTAKKA